MNRPSDPSCMVTFMLIAYNQERFIREAIIGAFSQTYSPLEIVLSDDCSTDRTFDIMQEMAACYNGPHTVVTRQNERNLGIGGHINAAVQQSKGELIIAAAGDDISLPMRVQRIASAYFRSERRAYSIYSDETLIDENGNQRNTSSVRNPKPNELTLRFFVHHRASVVGSSHAWQKRVFDFFGPLDSGLVNEDCVIPFRSVLLGEIVFINEPLVLRRVHTGNISLGRTRLHRTRSAEDSRRALIEMEFNHYKVLLNKLRDIDTYIESGINVTTATMQHRIHIDYLLRQQSARIDHFTRLGQYTSPQIQKNITKMLGPLQSLSCNFIWYYPRQTILARRIRSFLRRMIA